MPGPRSTSPGMAGRSSRPPSDQLASAARPATRLRGHPPLDRDRPDLDYRTGRCEARQRGNVVLPSPDLVEGAIDPNPRRRPDRRVQRAGQRPPDRGPRARWPDRHWSDAPQRRWRLLPAGDRAWRQLTAAAGRAGVGPRPSETIYEYAGWLEEQLPSHAEPIQTVADGKVWQSYSGRRLTLSAPTSSRTRCGSCGCRWSGSRCALGPRLFGRDGTSGAQSASGRPSASSTCVGSRPSRCSVSFQRSSRHLAVARGRRERRVVDVDGSARSSLRSSSRRARMRSVPPWLTRRTGHVGLAVGVGQERRTRSVASEIGSPPGGGSPASAPRQIPSASPPRARHGSAPPTRLADLHQPRFRLDPIPPRGRSSQPSPTRAAGSRR